MVQWVKTLANKPDDLSSVPGTHMVQETTHSHVSSDLYMYYTTEPHLLCNIDTQNKQTAAKKKGKKRSYSRKTLLWFAFQRICLGRVSMEGARGGWMLKLHPQYHQEVGPGCRTHFLLGDSTCQSFHSLLPNRSLLSTQSSDSFKPEA